MPEKPFVKLGNVKPSRTSNSAITYYYASCFRDGGDFNHLMELRIPEITHRILSLAVH